MSNEDQVPSATIRVGGRSLAPSFTARGTAAQIKTQVSTAFGFKASEADSLAEALVIAQLKGDELFAKHLQAGTGATEEDPPAKAETAPKRSGRGKAEASDAPEDPVSKDMLASKDLSQLREVWTKAKAVGALDKAVHEPLFKKIATERKWV